MNSKRMWLILLMLVFGFTQVAMSKVELLSGEWWTLVIIDAGLVGAGFVYALLNFIKDKSPKH